MSGCDSQSYGPAGSSKVLVEYVWTASVSPGAHPVLQSKTRVLDARPNSVEEIPPISVGTSGNNGALDGGEVYLRPRKLFRDPFRGGDHLLVLCDSFALPEVQIAPDFSAAPPPLQPHHSNSRVACENVVRRAQSSKPLVSVEQEYIVFPTDNAPTSSANSGQPTSRDTASATGFAVVSCGGWPHSHLPDPTKPYFVPVAGSASRDVRSKVAPSAAARQLSEAHLQHCMTAGINIIEASQSSTPNTWGYKLAASAPVELADQLWLSRLVLQRLAEQLGVTVLLNSPFEHCGSAGPGCFFKFSTHETRQPGTGLSIISQHLERLQARHMHHMMLYGSARNSSCSPFTCAYGTRGASMVVPTSTLLARGGHYVDRRALAGADPYVVIMLLVSTTLEIPMPARSAPRTVINLDQLNTSNPHFSSNVYPPASPSISIAHSGRRHLHVHRQSLQKPQPCTSEDVLIDELQKIDRCMSYCSQPDSCGSLGCSYGEVSSSGFSSLPSSQPGSGSLLDSACSGSNMMVDSCCAESCSDGTSPDRSPLLLLSRDAGPMVNAVGCLQPAWWAFKSSLQA